jgi:hypothetical protein
MNVQLKVDLDNRPSITGLHISDLSVGEWFITRDNMVVGFKLKESDKSNNTVDIVWFDDGRPQHHDRFVDRQVYRVINPHLSGKVQR